MCLDGVLDHEDVIECRDCHVKVTFLITDKRVEGQGAVRFVNHRSWRLAGKRITKCAICRGSAQLLPDWPLQFIRKAAGEAQQDYYAKTLLSSPSMEGYAGVSSWLERSFQHDEKLKIRKKLGKERRSMKQHTDKAFKVIFGT